MPEKWATLRPDQLKPLDFIDLTVDLYGLKKENSPIISKVVENVSNDPHARSNYVTDIVWRRSVNVRLDHIENKSISQQQHEDIDDEIDVEKLMKI